MESQPGIKFLKEPSPVLHKYNSVLHTYAYCKICFHRHLITSNEPPGFKILNEKNPHLFRTKTMVEH